MSHIHAAVKNKQPKHPKVPFEDYLYHSDEPKSAIYSDKMLSSTGESLEDSYFLRRRIRFSAQGVRSRLM